MAPWTCTSQEPRKRRYKRPLGMLELGFYWDSVFNGTADSIHHATVSVDPTKVHEVFSLPNVSQAWFALKTKFPLLSAQVRELPGDSGADFHVYESRLSSVTEGELELFEVESQEVPAAIVESRLKDGYGLSNSLLSRVSILIRKDAPGVVHVVIHSAHCITDGMANHAIMRGLLDRLACTLMANEFVRGDDPNSLEERLALALPSEDLMPGLKNTPARQRWHRAIGLVLSNIRTAKMTGGHTLPLLIKPNPSLPAQSRVARTSLPPSVSSAVILACRQHRVTFGVAYPVIAQLALSRVLSRCYLAGRISDDEWESRRKEPYHTAGPLNLRPFLQPDWYAAGGDENVSVCIGFFFLTLPFVPLPSSECLRRSNRIPELKEMISEKRFWLRCEGVRRQNTREIRNARFLDVGMARGPGRVERMKGLAKLWREGKSKKDGEELWWPVRTATMGHGGSSLGNVDFLLPRSYPLLKSKSEPVLRLVTSETRLHCRPGELYLGASTSRGQLHLNVFWDGNVYDEDLVKEWLDEVRGATELYLGRTNDPPTIHGKL